VKQRSPLRRAASVAALVTVAAALSACNTVTRLSQVGEEPPLSRISNPATGQAPVTMPMPAPTELSREANSLWRPGARAFFKDQRAASVGDILTVTINIADTATLSNESTRTRANTEKANASSMLGYQNIWKYLPFRTDAIDPTNLIDAGSNTSNAGAASVSRGETVTLRVAAVVTQILPNGNLVIQGTQEVRVNFENRLLQIAGVIRPQDIRSDNQIPYDRIAEARIAYGGRGQMTDFQQPRWGQQVFDILFPF
jgi:flagellar L-ring protein precursor FlgH